jgi:hypothetical protein
MARLVGAQRLVLQAIQDSPKDAAGFVSDVQVVQAASLALDDVRDWIETLEGEGYVEVAPTAAGLSAIITAKGRLSLRHRPERPIEAAPPGEADFESSRSTRLWFPVAFPIPADVQSLISGVWKVEIFRHMLSVSRPPESSQHALSEPFPEQRELILHLQCNDDAIEGDYDDMLGHHGDNFSIRCWLSGYMFMPRHFVLHSQPVKSGHLKFSYLLVELSPGDLASKMTGKCVGYGALTKTIFTEDILMNRLRGS